MSQMARGTISTNRRGIFSAATMAAPTPTAITARPTSSPRKKEAAKTAMIFRMPVLNARPRSTSPVR